MLVKELVAILLTLDQESIVLTLDEKDNKVEPSVHIDNYLNKEKQEVIIY